ncbi:MAG: patched family protein, partial [bacterium]|nr:patched family protein [bacterium]
MNTRQRLDLGFAHFSGWVVVHCRMVIAVCLLVVATLASNIPNLYFDTATESFLHADDPTLLAYNAFRDQFGRDEMVLVSLRPERVCDLDFLEMLRELHERLEEEVPHLDE